ncbi:hypothetical protein CWS01_09535 [Niallia nealsonii]|uniref:histidine kinase n=2 Tax=Niallia nealsonii TaxID=115979 RepID=A0A2N0Z3A7_9BACI|nr:hypothetical protein CWS01_09535 [Niallia nealsonii]
MGDEYIKRGVIMSSNFIYPKSRQIVDYNSRQGHILYMYERVDKYVENAVAFIVNGAEKGHYVLWIDKEELYHSIYQKVKSILKTNELPFIHFIQDKEFTDIFVDSPINNIQSYYSEIIQAMEVDKLSISSWFHVSGKVKKNEYTNLYQIGEYLTEMHCSTEQKIVLAVEGDDVSASYQNRLLHTYPNLMTDLQIVESPLYMPDNDPTRTNYKERVKLEGILKATNQQLESFIMRNLDPVMILNNDDDVLTINDAFEKVFGWTAAETVGKNSLQLPHIPIINRKEVYQNKCITLLGENVGEYETVRLTKEGISLHVQISCFPLRDEYDRVNGRAVIIRDITEKKQAQELLIKTEKLSIAGELAAGIAHEIRNPVTAIKGFLQLMEHGNMNNKTYFEIMEAEIERIELILSELLMLSKPQVIQYESTNISMLIRDIVILLEAQAIMNNVGIELDFESDDIILNGEKNQLKQVAINFIKNAIEAMPKGGKLMVQLRKYEEKQLLIRFIDEGCGIPDYVLSKLGQPFYTTKEKGTGLGFMVSKRIIENHNGTVSIYSKENIGTTIDVMLPL